MLSIRQSNVHQLLMGEGKSTVIAPLINLIGRHELNLSFIHCMPQHLIYQSTEEIFKKYLSRQFLLITNKLDLFITINELNGNINTIYIISDSYLKQSVIHTIYNNNKFPSISKNLCFMFDEIHQIGDNKKSEYNYVTPDNIKQIIDVDTKITLVCDILDVLFNNKSIFGNQLQHITFEPNIHYKSLIPPEDLINKINECLDKINNHDNIYYDKYVSIFKNITLYKRLNVDFGVRYYSETSEDNNPIAVPFLAANTPHPKNEFIDTDLDICYTIITYDYQTIKHYFIHEFIQHLIHLHEMAYDNSYLIDTPKIKSN